MGDERVKKKKKMMAGKNKGVAPEDAIRAIGLGYDLTNDLKLKSCKNHSRLIAIDDDNLRTVELPPRISIPNVPKSIKCDKGDRMRLCSDVLSFQQVLPYPQVVNIVFLCTKYFLVTKIVFDFFLSWVLSVENNFFFFFCLSQRFRFGDQV